MKFGSLQVMTPDGEAREFPIDLPSLVVGRADGSGIVIDDLSISRRHARLIIESGRLLVEDLGSAAGTFLGGHRIDPHTSNLVETEQAIRFGDVEVQYVPPPPVAAEAGDSDAEGAGLTEFEEVPSSAIRVSIVSPAAPVEPGGAVFATAVIHNRGRVVDLVQLSVTGIPAGWVTFSQGTMALVPGTRETVTLVIQPPLSPESLAGEYDFGVTVASGEHDREAVAFGKLTVLPFDATELHLLPIRSKRDFTMTARNNGNALVTYVLSGTDDEAAFLYDFQQPSIELRPGEERRVPVRVKKTKRQWFGRPTFVPFRVVATPTTGKAPAVEAPGQLAIRPPLERWKMPTILLLLLAAIAVGGWLSWVHRDRLPAWVPWAEESGGKGGGAAAEGEAAFAGVHMCDKDEKDRPSVQPQELPGGSSGAPYFAQNNPAWADIEYAKAKDPEFGPDWCGTTIEQCGCAMTSVATIMAIFNILTMPDGSELTPEAVNAWFNNEARKTSRGWVSRGYIYGDVIWTAANELSAEIARTRPGSTTIRFVRFGTGSDEEIRAELQAQRPIILEVPGHYIAAVGLDGDKILINDPYYADRKTLDVYKGKVKSSVLFEPSNNLSGVVITVPKDLRLRVVNVKTNQVVGTVSEEPAKTEIDGAWLSTRNAWRDPTCVESPPPPGAGTTSIYLPGSREDYRIEVLNPGGGGSTIAIHSYDQNGNAEVTTEDATGTLVMSMSYDPASAAVRTQVLAGATPIPGSGTPGAGETVTLPPGGPGGGTGGAGDDGPGGVPTTGSETATAQPTPTPRPSATPVPTPTPVAPQAVAVKCDIAYTPPNAGVTCTGTVTGTYTTTRWSVNGLPAPVPPGSTSFATTFSQDTSLSVEMTACNVTVCKTGAAAVVIAFPTATPTPSPSVAAGTPTPTATPLPNGPPLTVPLLCTYAWVSGQAKIDCSTSFSEGYTEITWTASGATPAAVTTFAKTFTTYRASAGTTTVQAKVCYASVCTNSAAVDVIVGSAPLVMSTVLNLVGPEGDVCDSTPVQLYAYIVNWDPNGPYPTGLITFYDQGAPIGTLPVESGEPQAILNTTFPGDGDHSIYATYSGDSTWSPASSPTVGFASSVSNCNP
ncbi:MAG: FHA domain-containing protein [Chloroflexi bacterium]|nr:FHA domain-containing protein [Chloroflexota bacterium]MCZ7576108.1 FHA domain-containing protein [Dehalococcoidia bacterium]